MTTEAKNNEIKYLDQSHLTTVFEEGAHNLGAVAFTISFVF